jgi:hypothetical protein
VSSSSEGLFRLASVAYAVTSEDPFYTEALYESRARQDDAYWAAYVRQPVTPQRYLNWWVARRWIIPRDPRRR